MITYVSKENNLGPDDKIRCIWGLKGAIFVPKCLGKWLYFINQGQLFQINYINTG